MEYTRPLGARIGRGQKTEKLYRLEHRRTAAIEAAARELGRVLGHDPEAYWQVTMPEAMLAILDTFDRSAVRLACQAWLDANPK